MRWFKRLKDPQPECIALYSFRNTRKVTISTVSVESFSDWGGGCRKFVPVLGGGGTKIASTGDIVDQPSGEVSSIRGKLADHVGDPVVLSLEGAALVTSSGTKSSYPSPPPIVERLGCQIRDNDT